MTDFLEIFSSDPTAPLLWIALALTASLTNGLLSLWAYRRDVRAGVKAQPPDYIGHVLEFAIVVLIIIMAFFCRLTVGKLLHAPSLPPRERGLKL